MVLKKTKHTVVILKDQEHPLFLVCPIVNIYRAQSIRVTSLRESLYTSFMKIAMVEQTKDKGCF